MHVYQGSSIVSIVRKCMCTLAVLLSPLCISHVYLGSSVVSIEPKYMFTLSVLRPQNNKLLEINRLCFSSFTVKTIDITMNRANTNFIDIADIVENIDFKAHSQSV